MSANPNRLYLLQCLIFLAVLIGVFSFSSPYFLSFGNIHNILTASAVIGLIAIGATFVIASGNIDLSSAAVMALSSTMCAWCLQKAEWSPSMAISVAVILGGLCGLASGFLINVTKAPSFIVTLGMMSISRALAYIISKGVPIYGLPDAVIAAAQEQIAHISLPVLLLIVGILLGWVILTKTKFGLHALILGDNHFVAEAMGISGAALRLKIFALAGLYSGLAGVIFTLRTNSGDPTAGQNYELIGITAVILGGANLFGGRASIIGTVLGVLCLGILQNGLNLLAVSTYYQILFVGLVLIGAAFFVASWIQTMSLALHHIFKAFGAIEVLEDIDIAFSAGEVTAIVGDNGAGKSTLLKLIAGIHRPDVGIIKLDGNAIAECSAAVHRRHGIEMVYQDLAIAKQHDVVTNLYLGREQSNFGFLNRKSMQRQVKNELDRLGVKIANLDLPVGYLSGGQQQAVAIARSVLFDPKVLLLDEPTAALAAREVDNVLDLIRQQKRQGRTVILVSHRLNDVFAVADRILVMKHGRIAIDVPTVATNLTQIVEHIVS